jgi:hypothetical protein
MKEKLPNFENTDLAQFQYSERLLLMDGMTSYFERPPLALTAKELGMPARYVHMHLCSIYI